MTTQFKEAHLLSNSRGPRKPISIVSAIQQGEHRSHYHHGNNTHNGE